MEGDIFVEGNIMVERRATDQGDEVAADGEQDEYDIDMQNESGRACNDYMQEELSTLYE